MCDPEGNAPKVKPPFSPPDCPWIQVKPDGPVPENAIYSNGTLDGDQVYIGRVYDGDCIFVGTAIPKKGVCFYLNKNLEVKSSPYYEILTMDCGDHLWFLEMELDHDQLFVSGIDEKEEILYTGRFIDDKYNTYYGWVSKETRSLYIPRDPTVGPQVLEKDFGILVHTLLHRMCTGCPVPPPEAVFNEDTPL